MLRHCASKPEGRVAWTRVKVGGSGRVHLILVHTLLGNFHCSPNNSLDLATHSMPPFPSSPPALARHLKLGPGNDIQSWRHISPAFQSSDLGYLFVEYGWSILLDAFDGIETSSPTQKRSPKPFPESDLINSSIPCAILPLVCYPAPLDRSQVEKRTSGMIGSPVFPFTYRNGISVLSFLLILSSG